MQIQHNSKYDNYIMSHFNPQRLVNLQPEDFSNDTFKKCLEDIEHDKGKDFVNSFVNNLIPATLNLIRNLNRNVDRKEFILQSFSSFDQIKLENFRTLLQTTDFNQLSEIAKSNNLANLTKEKLGDYLLGFSEEKIETLFVMICAIN